MTLPAAGLVPLTWLPRFDAAPLTVEPAVLLAPVTI
jgi:hypothetical protein